MAASIAARSALVLCWIPAKKRTKAENMERTGPDQTCPAEIFHETVAALVVASAPEYPDMTEEQVLQSILQLLLAMAVPAGNC